MILFENWHFVYVVGDDLIRDTPEILRNEVTNEQEQPCLGQVETVRIDVNGTEIL